MVVEGVVVMVVTVWAAAVLNKNLELKKEVAVVLVVEAVVLVVEAVVLVVADAAEVEPFDFVGVLRYKVEHHGLFFQTALAWLGNQRLYGRPYLNKLVDLRVIHALATFVVWQSN